MPKILMSSELLQKIAAGQKEFDGIGLQYADMSGRTFDGLVFRNCEFYFVDMRHCSFREVAFENCRFFFAGFRGSEFRDCAFTDCEIEYSGLSATFIDTKMAGTRISWSDMIEANAGGLEMQNCAEFKVFRNVSDLTPDDLRTGLAQLQPALDRLDFDIKQKVLNLIEGGLRHYGVDVPATGAPDRKYGGHEPAQHAGYRLFDAIINTAIGAYGEKSTYQAKNIYETKPEKKDPRDRR